MLRGGLLLTGDNDKQTGDGVLPRDQRTHFLKVHGVIGLDLLHTWLGQHYSSEVENGLTRSQDGNRILTHDDWQRESPALHIEFNRFRVQVNFVLVDL